MVSVKQTLLFFGHFLDDNYYFWMITTTNKVSGSQVVKSSASECC